MQECRAELTAGAVAGPPGETGQVRESGSGTAAKEARMTYDRLVCANCAAPVSEGRCPVCRANRERLQQESPFAGLNPMALIALLAVLIAALALVAHQTV